MPQFVDIKRYLPHTEPMLMVDELLSLDADNSETVFTIKETNVFNDNGFFCEAGMIENAAQTCSAIVAWSYFVDENGDDKGYVKLVGFISSIKTVKLYGLPKTGEQIRTIAALKSKFDTGSYITCAISCNTYRGDELLLEGEMNLLVQEV